MKVISRTNMLLIFRFISVCCFLPDSIWTGRVMNRPEIVLCSPSPVTPSEGGADHFLRVLQ